MSGEGVLCLLDLMSKKVAIAKILTRGQEKEWLYFIGCLYLNCGAVKINPLGGLVVHPARRLTDPAWPCILSRTNSQGVPFLKPKIRGSYDTNRIIYRCFLPDLTGFIIVCCVTSNPDFRRG